MAQLPSRRLPVVAGLAYHERVDRLPSQFTATLQAEAGNRFNRRAVAVLVSGEKVGYLPPELSPHYWRHPGDGAVTECSGYRAPLSAVEDTGVMLVLDPPVVADGD